MDITGRVINVLPLTATKTSIDVTALSEGVYIIVLLKNDVDVSRRKIIIE